MKVVISEGCCGMFPARVIQQIADSLTLDCGKLGVRKNAPALKCMTKSDLLAIAASLSVSGGKLVVTREFGVYASPPDALLKQVAECAVVCDTEQCITQFTEEPPEDTNCAWQETGECDLPIGKTKTFKDGSWQ